MNAWTKLLTALLCFGIPHSVVAQQKSISNILQNSNAGLEENLKTLDNYYSKVLKKSGGRDPNEVEVKHANNSKNEISTTKGGVSIYQNKVENLALTRSGADRDPFAYTDRIRLNAAVFGGGGVSYSPKPINSQAAFPRMQMKGFLSGGEDASIGLLEIDGMGVQVVRKGDVIGLQQVGLDAVVRIIDMSNLGFIVETGSSGQAIVVR